MIEFPHDLYGTPEEQIAQVNAYLYRIAEAVNVALQAVEITNSAKEERENFSVSSGAESVSVTESTYKALRQVIIQTAEIIKHTKDELNTKFSEEYVAISDYGELNETLLRNIQETARGVVETFNYDSRLENLSDSVDEFNEYKISTEGYIRRGWVEEDESGVPKIGIAIGQNLTSTTVDGEQKFDENQNMAIWTADKLSFRVNGQEAALVSNGQFRTKELAVLGAFYFGDEWSLPRTNGFTLKWIGGEV